LSVRCMVDPVARLWLFPFKNATSKQKARSCNTTILICRWSSKAASQKIWAHWMICAGVYQSFQDDRSLYKKSYSKEMVSSRGFIGYMTLWVS
jgi:hypothetical protein